jgi:hypothetical protein
MKVHIPPYYLVKFELTELLRCHRNGVEHLRKRAH